MRICAKITVALVQSLVKYADDVYMNKLAFWWWTNATGQRAGPLPMLLPSLIAGINWDYRPPHTGATS
jgi:hypothetical protein